MYQGWPHNNYGGRLPWRFAVTPRLAPSTLPVSLALAKSQCNIEPGNTTDDSFLTNIIIPAAVQDYEDWTQECLVTRTLTMTCDDFPYPLYEFQIPRYPVQSITSLQYLDPAGAQQTVDSSFYTLDKSTLPPKLFLQWAKFWPPQRPIQNAITLQFVAGYGQPTDNPATIPANALRTVLLLIEAYYNYRSGISQGIAITQFPFGLQQGILGHRMSCF